MTTTNMQIQVKTEDYHHPCLVFYCHKCGKPYRATGLAHRLEAGMDYSDLIVDVINAAEQNDRLEVYYGDRNPLSDYCKCSEQL